MLKSLALENFKGIAGRQRIDFAPLTLLFGANSAGKSTVLQALLYLHEVLERGIADVDRTELGGTVLELGGFARLVHRHEMTRSIVLRAEFATAGGLDRLGRELADFPFPDLDDDIEAAWLELTIRHRTTAAFTGAVVERAVIGVAGDSEPLVWLELGASLREGEPLNVRVNLGHPLLATETRELEGAIVTEADGSKHPLTAQHASADLTEAWEQIAVPEAPVCDGSVSRSGNGARTDSTSGSRSGPPRVDEKLAPFAIAQITDQPFLQQDLLERLQMQPTDLFAAIRGHVEDVRRQGVFGEESHQNTSRNPSSKNPPGQAFTSSPRSLRGISRTMLRGPSGSTKRTITSSGRTARQPSGSVDSKVSRIRRITRSRRCSLWVSSRKVFRRSPSADSMNTSGFDSRHSFGLVF